MNRINVNWTKRFISNLGKRMYDEHKENITMFIYYNCNNHSLDWDLL